MAWRALILIFLCAATPACGWVPPVTSPAEEGGAATAIADPPGGVAAPIVPAEPQPSVEALLEQAAAIEPLKAVVVARDGTIVAERGYGGARPESSTKDRKSVV